MSGVDEAGFEVGMPQTKAKEVSEADLGNVSESLKKAQQMGAKIAQAQKQNQLFAEMLKIIIANIDNDKILTTVFKSITEYEIDIDKIFELFYPILKNKIDHEQINEKFKSISGVDISSVSLYGIFVKECLKNPKLQEMDKEEFVEFIKEIIYSFNIGNIKNHKNKPEELEELTKNLRSSLMNVFYN